MARYRKIDPRIWNDEKFSSLSDAGQLAFLFVLTHPLMTSLGALRGTPEGLAGEKYGWEASNEGFREAFREAFAELSRKGLLRLDGRGLIFAPNFLKYNRPESPNVIKAWKGSLDLLPECQLLAEVLIRAKACIGAMSKAYQEAFQEAFGEDLEKALTKASVKTMPNQEQEQEQEQEKEKVEKEISRPKVQREPTVPFPGALPAEWRQAALTARKDVTPERVFQKLRSRYAPTSSRKTLGNWRKIFLDWIGREFPENTGRASLPAAQSKLPPHKDPTFHFDAEYYADAINPDGTTNWGV